MAGKCKVNVRTNVNVHTDTQTHVSGSMYLCAGGTQGSSQQPFVVPNRESPSMNSEGQVNSIALSTWTTSHSKREQDDFINNRDDSPYERLAEGTEPETEAFLCVILRQRFQK